MTIDLFCNIYRLPIPEAAITATVLDNMLRGGPYKGSIDYAVPVGTPVYALAKWIVTRLKDDFEQYANDATFDSLVNYATIQHENDELSEYLHLAKGSAEVTIGESVRAGQLIGYTGLSGWLTAPHLHFMVYAYDDSRPGGSAGKCNSTS